jgi:hypothetical protein
MEPDAIAGISIPRIAQIRPILELSNAGWRQAASARRVNHLYYEMPINRAFFAAALTQKVKVAMYGPTA